ncbi:MAG: ABC transporter permease [Ignisphaera sp.]
MCKKFKQLNLLIALVLIFLVWEAVVYLFKVPRYVLPAPTAIASTTLRYSSYLLENLLDTTVSALVGLIIATITSFALSIAMSYSKTLRDTLFPLLASFNTIPRAALVPLLVIWFGLGWTPRVLTAFLLAFFPMIVPVLTAMTTVEKELVELLAAYGASKMKILVKVSIPKSLPYLMSSLHTGLTSAYVGAVIAEMIASDKGIGYVILSSSSRLDTPLVFACLILLSVTTLVASKIISVVEKRVAKWAYRSEA